MPFINDPDHLRGFEECRAAGMVLTARLHQLAFDTCKA
jgi:hypothetical protein